MLSQHWLACVLTAFRYIFRVGSESDLAPGNQPGNDPSREFGHTVDISAVGHLLPGNRFFTIAHALLQSCTRNARLGQ
jgi:hypothetical protein